MGTADVVSRMGTHNGYTRSTILLKAESGLIRLKCNSASLFVRLRRPAESEGILGGGGAAAAAADDVTAETAPTLRMGLIVTSNRQGDVNDGLAIGLGNGVLVLNANLATFDLLGKNHDC